MTTLRIPSETTPGQEYRVDVRHGQAVCDCPAGAMGRECKHAREAKEMMMVTEQRIPDEGPPYSDMADIPETAMGLAGDGPPLPLPVRLEERTLPTQGELQIISTIARTVIGAKGHAVPASIDTPAKAAAVMLAGWELGLKPMTALRHVFVVNGRTEPDGSAMMGLVKAGDPTAAFIFHTYTNELCDVSLHRGGHLAARCEYTLKDAQASGQAKKKRVKDRDTNQWKEIDGPWQLYVRDMLAWNAVKRVCRLGAPDLINAITSVNVRMVDGLLPEPIETVAIGESGRTLDQERKSAAFVQKVNDDYRPPPKGAPVTAEIMNMTPEEEAEAYAEHEAGLGPELATFIGQAPDLPDALKDEPDPSQETPEELAERIAEEKRLAAETGQAAMLPPDPASKVHP